MSERKMGHVQPMKVYVGVLLALFVLTGVTVFVSRFDFGSFNDVVAVLIAVIKGTLVTLIFMHGKYENRMTWAFVYYPVILLLLLLGSMFLDYGFRDPKDFKVEAQSITRQHDADGATHDDSAADHDGDPAEGEANPEARQQDHDAEEEHKPAGERGDP